MTIRAKCCSEPLFNSGAGLCLGDDDDAGPPCVCELERGHDGPHTCECCGRIWLELFTLKE